MAVNGVAADASAKMFKWWYIFQLCCYKPLNHWLRRYWKIHSISWRSQCEEYVGRRCPHSLSHLQDCNWLNVSPAGDKSCQQEQQQTYMNHWANHWCEQRFRGLEPGFVIAASHLTPPNASGGTFHVIFIATQLHGCFKGPIVCLIISCFFLSDKDSSKHSLLPERCRACTWSKHCQGRNLLQRNVMCLNKLISAAWEKTMLK